MEYCPKTFTHLLMGNTPLHDLICGGRIEGLGSSVVECNRNRYTGENPGRHQPSLKTSPLYLSPEPSQYLLRVGQWAASSF